MIIIGKTDHLTYTVEWWEGDTKVTLHIEGILPYGMTLRSVHASVYEASQYVRMFSYAALRSAGFAQSAIP